MLCSTSPWLACLPSVSHLLTPSLQSPAGFIYWAVRTNPNTLSGFKMTEIHCLPVLDHESTVKVVAALPLKVLEENPPLLLLASGGSRCSLASGCVPPISVPVSMWLSPPLSMSSPLLSLLRTLVLGFRTCPSNPGWFHILRSLS